LAGSPLLVRIQELLDAWVCAFKVARPTNRPDPLAQDCA
jgi:hypothetical protein